MSADFIDQVKNSNASDGRDFWFKFEVKTNNGYYFICEKSTGLKFGNFQSKSKKVIKALISDASQNYGR